MAFSDIDIIKEELRIPIKYIKAKNDIILLTAHKNWISNLLVVGPLSFINHERLTEDEIAAQPSDYELGTDWTRVYIKVYEKQFVNACPLPRGRPSVNNQAQSELTFSQLLHYIAETNYRNLWKEAYKKYNNAWNYTESKEQSYLNVNVNDVAIMQEALTRMYGCPTIQIRDGNVLAVSQGTTNECHCNLLPALFVIETLSAFVILYEQTAQYSVRECVMYSPAALTTSYGKPLFLVYQLLRLSRNLHDLGLVLGEITLSDIFLTDNFTVQVLPKLSDNIYLKPESELNSSCHDNKINEGSRRCDQLAIKKSLTKNSNYGTDESIERLCEQWVHNCISNYDYLTALNNLAGRKFGDPSCHHVMPWVTDFTLRCGGNWRDLTKSKFRLNKGDRQLDLTFDSESGEVGHHVSDVLSEITYYVYLSRRYSKSVLCKHVRPQWVPGEYPASIQRLFDWTPDECIPQFFTDPTVFKSIHEDLPDLEIPAWATSPEDFIEKHREALESFHVSERLHHWIDLTFGYKLSGIPAIKSKNVCLQLVDNHTSLTSSGVVQLFTQPHPQKIVPSPYYGKIAPRVRATLLTNKLKSENSKTSDDEGHSSGFEEEELLMPQLNTSRSSPLALSRLLSRSRGSLLTTEDNLKSDRTSQAIVLPKDYNPLAALSQVETMHTFMNKVNHQIYKPNATVHDNSINCKQIVACGRLKDLQILGCLIVEIFMPGKFLATWNMEKISFIRRYNVCVNTLKNNAASLPKLVRNAVSLLLQIDITPKSYNIDNIEINETTLRYPTVTLVGLPPPSAHQFLQPILSSNLFPSSKYCAYLFNVIEMIREYNYLAREINYLISNDDDAESIRTKVAYLCKISECKVKAIAREIEKLLPNADISREASTQLIVPHIQQVMEEPYSAVLATWYLFDPVAKALGPKETANALLLSIMKLYENGSIMDNLSPDTLASGSIAKFRTTRLYHRSFLLKLMVRLGLKRFLENFITPLVEAVGGYRDYVQGSMNTNVQRTGHLKNCDLSGTNINEEMMLSPLDEDSSADSEIISSSPRLQTNEYSRNTIDNDVEEVFAMESEDNNWTLNVNTPYNTDLNIDLTLNLSDESNEDTNKASPPGVMKSPTIPIPRQSSNSGGGKSVTEFSSIGCHVGSKTSSDDIAYNEICSTSILPSSVTSEPICTDHEESHSSHNQLSSTDTKTENASQETENQAECCQKKLLHNIECTVSEMSAESIIWLSHRLGPVLTARHLSRNLLRMLTLCYVGKENLSVLNNEIFNSTDFNCYRRKFIGDCNASKVIECLSTIAGLYGEQIILLQYFAHIAELLALCKRKLTQNLEGGLVSCLALFNNITQCISDATLMDTLHESIIKAILCPTIRIIATTRFTFPNGSTARSALAEKCLEALSMLSKRLGSVVTKEHLSIPIQRFFLVFDKAFSINSSETIAQGTMNELYENDNQCLLNRDEYKNSKNVSLIDNCEIAESYSPPIADKTDTLNLQRNKAVEELNEVFTVEFAHRSYMLFYRNVGREIAEQILKNHQHIRELCHRYEQEKKLTSPCSDRYPMTMEDDKDPGNIESDKPGTSFGSISVVGNRFEMQKCETKVQPSETAITVKEPLSSSYTGRQLRGNWLAYWEHEIGRPDKDTALNIKQIKLQHFTGHTNSVRCLYVLNNENSFISGSRDKTIKLWSLRSQGDGNTVSSCQYTYTGHKKSILALTFLESLRYAVTCDGIIHYWDPFMGSLLGSSEGARSVPVNALAANPSPSTTLLAATTDITLRVIDCRTFQHVNEMKVSMNPTGLIRCIAIAPSGHWVALGQASGFLTILDIRTGLIIASWKGHECEILQLEAVNESTIISSSLDQTIAVWSALDGKLKYHMKGATEPVHCMAIYEQELIIGTTANRVGVYSAIDSTAAFSSSKLRSESFKGLLTAMSILPLNRLLLLGADNGGISLVC